MVSSMFFCRLFLPLVFLQRSGFRPTNAVNYTSWFIPVGKATPYCTRKTKTKNRNLRVRTFVCVHHKKRPYNMSKKRNSCQLLSKTAENVRCYRALISSDLVKWHLSQAIKVILDLKSSQPKDFISHVSQCVRSLKSLHCDRCMKSPRRSR